jgi:hypothetical protein
MKISKYSVYLGIYPIVLAWYFNHSKKKYYTLGLITSICNHITRGFINNQYEFIHDILALIDKLVLGYVLLFIENNNYILLKYIISFVYLSSKLLFLNNYKEDLHVLSHALISGYILIQISNNLNK